jgi:molecular chaperone GrpE
MSTQQPAQPEQSTSDDATVLANEETAALIERLTAERDEALAAYKRALADFANFQRRASESELRARDGGIVYIARALMPVLDQMDLALAQNTAALTVEQMLQAIAMVRAEMNKALEKSGIERIAPPAGAEFDPHHHEAVMRQPLDGVEPGRIATCFQVGYRLGDMTLRPAKISVTPD